ncbi:hypothetical protein CYY_009780 [Polysphondylium violaceum]|uniref:TM7S3/TM198-like domain-containing protein n=1 Tax=Polysphondylium violaceum TaxID=133409 RepID=A0A8J4UP95_9MYCE|nr:hypothetical protein CYY_009780 [Polysphondylium violaceum]
MDHYLGLLFLLSGAGLFTFGFRFQEWTISLFGSSTGAFVLYNLYANNYIHLSQTMLIVCSVITSVLCSLLFLHFRKLAIGLLSIITSFSLINLMSPGLSHFIPQILNYVVLIIVPTMYICVPEAGMLISTSFYGAWVFVNGIDSFIGAGFPNTLAVLFDTHWDAKVSDSSSAFLESILVCFILFMSLLLQVFVVSRLFRSKQERQASLLNMETTTTNDYEEDYNTDICTSCPCHKKQLNEIIINIGGSDSSDNQLVGDNETPFIDPTLQQQEQKVYEKEKKGQCTESSKPFLS